MNDSHFRIDQSTVMPNDPRYSKRVESQHQLALAPVRMVASLAAGVFLALPFASRNDGFPISIMPAGVVSVLLLAGFGLAVMALAQGVWRLIPAFWSLQTSLDELPESQRILWQIFELGGSILWFGIGAALAYQLA